MDEGETSSSGERVLLVPQARPSEAKFGRFVSLPNFQMTFISVGLLIAAGRELQKGGGFHIYLLTGEKTDCVAVKERKGSTSWHWRCLLMVLNAGPWTT